jgi:lysophospholipase L1-like esterase
VGARSQEHALSGQLAQALSGHFHLEWCLEARTGMCCRELIQSLRQCKVRVCDVAVVSIGVNDVTGGRRGRDWRTDLEALIEILASEVGARRVLISPLPPMHAFSALPQPLRWVMGQRARHFNCILHEVVSADERCLALTHEFPVRADFLASDGFHPGEAAYAHWAQRIADAVVTDHRCSGAE